jgi:Ohr subfamily peroxiredoxin
MGGPGKLGTATPEHLFAAGYAACFGGSLDFVAKQRKKDASTAELTCAAMIGVREDGGFGLAVKKHVEDKSIGGADLAIFVREAHETICPDSHATRGNVMSRSRWPAVKDVTTAFEPPCMHGAAAGRWTSLCSRHSDRKGTAGIAAVQSQLGDSKLRPFVLTLWRFNMEKNTEHKKAKDEETTFGPRDPVDYSLSRSGYKG